MNRAYCTIEIKAVEDATGKRTFRGIASTASTDRMGDVVEPKGAKFKLPIPLLWQHNSREPIGWVTAARVTASGIEVDGEVATVEEEGTLKQRLTEAWQMLKAKLVRGLSIGFNTLESARIDGTYGLHFLSWEWLELSCVTIPANQDASITSIKSIDSALLAASGQEQRGVGRLPSSPGVSGKQTKAASRGVSLSQKGPEMKTIAEQIAALEAKRAASTERMAAVMQVSLDEGRSSDAAEGEEFDTLQQEVKQIDVDLVRLKALEAINVAKAKPVTAANTEDSAAASQTRGGGNVLLVKDNKPKGMRFAQYVKCMYAARGNPFSAEQFAKQYYPDDPLVMNSVKTDVLRLIKATVAGASTSDATWAGSLVDYTNISTDFIEFLRPQTILGKFGSGGIPDLTHVPFNVKIQSQTSGGNGYWVGEGKPKPLTKFDFAPFTLNWAKVANIAVMTEESMRFSTPSLDMLVRNGLAAALIERLDIDFIDPQKAAVAGVSPASITNLVAPIVSSGNDADAIRADVKAAMTTFIAANMSLMSGVWIMTATTALALSLMRNALGQKEFPDITMLGGKFEGLPVIVSEYVITGSDGEIVVLMSAKDVYVADDGVVTIDASREASIQMLDNPTNDSVVGTATSLVSMFQTDSVALRAERYINWKKARSAAVTYIDGVNWGTAS